MDAWEEVQYLLERMLELAVCAARDDCSNTRRAQLQKGLALLRELLDQAAERCQ